MSAADRRPGRGNESAELATRPRPLPIAGPQTEVGVQSLDPAALRRAVAPPGRLRPDDILALQGVVGNRAVADLIRARRAVATPDAGPEPQPAIQRAGVEQAVDPEDPSQTATNPLNDFTSLPGEVQARISPSRYRDLVKDKDTGPGVRVTLIGTHKLLSRQGDAWNGISLVTWVGTGNMLVTVRSAEDYKRLLEAQGFKDEWLAASGADLWGLRKTVDGVGLHIRGKAADSVEIHFDLHPPKWYALFGLWHVIMDKVFRSRTVTPESLRKALDLEGQL